MKISDFKLEKWLNPLAPEAKYSLGVSCVKPMHLDELFELIGEDVDTFLQTEMRSLSLHYGHFFGLERLKVALARLYRDAGQEHVLTVHGGTGANHMALAELAEPGTNVVAFLPNYQQHYAIPESLGVEVRHLRLRPEDHYLPDLDQLRRLVDGHTRLITFSNPNNPTGAYMPEATLREIAGIADRVGAFILSDEIYRGLADDYMASAVDVYPRAIVSSSMSKVFSMAGTRVGWLVVKDRATFDRLENRRSYDTICGGVFDELVAAKAMEHADRVLARARAVVRPSKAIYDAWLPTQPGLHQYNESLGTTVFLSYDYDLPSTRLCAEVFDRKGVLLCHGDCFEMPRTFRLGYGYDREEHFQAGLQVLGDYLATLR
jgi:aspartate/methionine/tyrosine aminotransferase